MLWWRYNGCMAHTLDINSGTTAELILFCRTGESYFPYQPSSESNMNPKTVGVPLFNGSNDFTVKVVYSYESQCLRFKMKIAQEYDQTFSYKILNHGGGAF